MQTQLYLPECYKPSSNDVIIGRGKKYYSHEGNNKLRLIVASRLKEYTGAKNKRAKSEVLTAVVNQVRSANPNGKFIRYEKNTKLWFDIGDDQAKEKVSQFFRNELGDSHSYATECEKKRRDSMGEENANPAKRAKHNPLHVGSTENSIQPSTKSLSDSCNVYKMQLYKDPFEMSSVMPMDKFDKHVSNNSLDSSQNVDCIKKSNKKRTSIIDEVKVDELEEIDLSGLLCVYSELI